MFDRLEDLPAMHSVKWGSIKGGTVSGVSMLEGSHPLLLSIKVVPDICTHDSVFL